MSQENLIENFIIKQTLNKNKAQKLQWKINSKKHREKKRKEIEYLRGKNKKIKKQISIMENNIRNLYQKYQKRYGLSKF